MFINNDNDKYKSIVDMLNSSKTEDSNYDEFIFLPVSLFKDYELSSVGKDKISKIINSKNITNNLIS